MAFTHRLQIWSNETVSQNRLVYYETVENEYFANSGARLMYEHKLGKDNLSTLIDVVAKMRSALTESI